MAKFVKGGHLQPGSKQMPPFIPNGHLSQSHQAPPFGAASGAGNVKGNALAMARKPSKVPFGSGARFDALKNKLAGRKGVKNPAALAAAIGRKKYGASKMASMANKGR